MKWPKIYHLPNSPGITDEDEVLPNLASFLGREILITEKLDGECTHMNCVRIHARSEDSKRHDSRTIVKGLHGNIRSEIPKHLEIVGENMQALHSIHYTRLTTIFYVFSIVDFEKGAVLPVKETLEWCRLLGIEHAPILYHGTFPEHFVIPNHSSFGDEIEGYVIRIMEEFPLTHFTSSIAKWVRPGHIKTGEFWMKNWKPNQLASQEVREEIHALLAKTEDEVLNKRTTSKPS